MVISEPLQIRLNQLTTEAYNLQKKCEERGDIPEKDLNQLEKILNSLKQEVVTVNQLTEGRVTNTGQKNVDEALKAILLIQQILPTQTDAKTINTLITQLFGLLSQQAKSVRGSRKKLEDLDKKLVRNKGIGGKIEKTFQSKQMGTK